MDHIKSPKINYLQTKLVATVRYRDEQNIFVKFPIILSSNSYLICLQYKSAKSSSKHTCHVRHMHMYTQCFLYMSPHTHGLVVYVRKLYTPCHTELFTPMCIIKNDHLCRQAIRRNFNIPQLPLSKSIISCPN